MCLVAPLIELLNVLLVAPVEPIDLTLGPTLSNHLTGLAIDESDHEFRAVRLVSFGGRQLLLRQRLPFEDTLDSGRNLEISQLCLQRVKG